MTTNIMTKSIIMKYAPGMGFEKDFRAALGQALASGEYENPTALARESGAQQASLHRFLANKGGLNLESVAKLVDKLGGMLVFPGDKPLARDVCWVDAQIVPAGEHAPKPDSEDYFAVPLVGEAGAGPGMMPEEKVKSWVLVYRHQRALRGHTDLLAVEIERRSTSMVPTLHPRDVVLVDRKMEDALKPGGIYLVREPGQDGGGKVKRVSITEKKDDTLIVYYSDNQAEHPPEIYSLRADYDGDIRKAIIGRVIWAWSDMTRK